MESKFKVGDMVAERIRPAQGLIVKRQAYHHYYCKMTEHFSRKELIFHERELQRFDDSPVKTTAAMSQFISAVQVQGNV